MRYNYFISNLNWLLQYDIQNHYIDIYFFK